MSLGHTLRATCGTLPSNENELLTRHLAMRTNSCFLTFGNGETGWKFGIRNWNWSNVKVPHLACQGVSTEFVLIENAMYRTLLATCEYGVRSH